MTKNTDDLLFIVSHYFAKCKVIEHNKEVKKERKRYNEK